LVLYWLFSIGIVCLGLATCFGWKYALAPSKFDFDHYDKWLGVYLRTHPDAIKEDAEKQHKENPNSAPIDFPLQKMYQRRIVLGKKAIIIFTGVGSILTAIASIIPS